MTFNCQPKGFLEELGKKMQAEGGFGSRQFLVGCFASVIEFGPQCLTNNNTTRPALKILL